MKNVFIVLNAAFILFFPFFAALASAQLFNCPPDDGYYRDPVQCDKYYDCYRGEVTEKLCPDGLVFDDSIAPRVAQCNYPFLITCPEGASLRKKLNTFHYYFS